uniref:Uncharacterized protein n=1 Tax=Anguilla anguilla TaxID=7936 RepID=A0A0E9T7K5_ANGAN
MYTYIYLQFLFSPSSYHHHPPHSQSEHFPGSLAFTFAFNT